MPAMRRLLIVVNNKPTLTVVAGSKGPAFPIGRMSAELTVLPISAPTCLSSDECWFESDLVFRTRN